MIEIFYRQSIKHFKHFICSRMGEIYPYMGMSLQHIFCDVPHLNNHFMHRPGSSGLIPLEDIASTWVSSCIHWGLHLGSSWKQTTYTLVDGCFHKLHSYACLTTNLVFKH